MTSNSSKIRHVFCFNCLTEERLACFLQIYKAQWFQYVKTTELAILFPGGAAPILASVIGVKPKTWRILASAEDPRHMVLQAKGNYHWLGSILKQAQLSHPPVMLLCFFCRIMFCFLSSRGIKCCRFFRVFSMFAGRLTMIGYMQVLQVILASKGQKNLEIYQRK